MIGPMVMRTFFFCLYPFYLGEWVSSLPAGGMGDADACSASLCLHAAALV